eukprot:340420_1
MTVFVDPETAKQFECAICFEMYKEPVQIGCEDHIFCKECTDELIATQGNLFQCPLCRTKCNADAVVRVKFIDRQINNLKVKCPNTITNNKCVSVGITKSKIQIPNNSNNSNSHSGTKRERSMISDEDNHNIKMRKVNQIEILETCEWKGLYSELNNHIKQCPLQSIACEYCSHSMLKRELETHYDTCAKFPIQCIKCKQTEICRNEMTFHISRNCPMTLINCDQCKQEVKRKDKKLHLQNKCPESLIECPFHTFGCMEKLKRKNEKNHIENAAFTHSHLIKVANHQVKLEKTVNALNMRIIALENQNTGQNIKITALETQIKEVPKHWAPNYKIVYADNKDKLYGYKKDTHELQYLGRVEKIKQ